MNRIRHIGPLGAKRGRNTAMKLKFKGEWRLTPPNDNSTIYYCCIPEEAVEEFIEIVGRMATQVEERKGVLEHFKRYFARAAGTTLGRHNIGYEIRPPRLVLRGEEQPSAAPPEIGGKVGIPSARRPKTENHQSYDYDVALSFAGEDRKYVEEVAHSLRSADVKVFYDLFEKATLWGQNLGDHLSEVYGKRSRFVVIFTSQHYCLKSWPTHERQSAQARAIREGSIVLLPARFDDTKIPGLPSTIGYIDLRVIKPKQLANVIIEKLRIA